MHIGLQSLLGELPFQAQYFIVISTSPQAQHAYLKEDVFRQLFQPYSTPSHSHGGRTFSRDHLMDESYEKFRLRQEHLHIPCFGLSGTQYTQIKVWSSDMIVVAHECRRLCGQTNLFLTRENESD